jgi:DNA-binding winged helix-turn-helix (wHTH) protein
MDTNLSGRADDDRAAIRELIALLRLFLYQLGLLNGQEQSPATQERAVDPSRAFATAAAARFPAHTNHLVPVASDLAWDAECGLLVTRGRQAIPLPRRQHLLMKALVKAYPRLVHADALACVLSEDRGQGVHAVRTAMWELRRHLRRVSTVVWIQTQWRFGYRLVIGTEHTPHHTAKGTSATTAGHNPAPSPHSPHIHPYRPTHSPREE